MIEDLHILQTSLGLNQPHYVIDHVQQRFPHNKVKIEGHNIVRASLVLIDKGDNVRRVFIDKRNINERCAHLLSDAEGILDDNTNGDNPKRPV
jgi:hypothetical protein